MIDPIDIVIQSVLSLLKFRDISLARAEYEVGRETVLRIPIAQRNVSELTSKRLQQMQPGLDAINGHATAPLESEDTARASAP